MTIKPLPLFNSTLLFLLPGLVFLPLYHLVFPWLLDQGIFYWHAFYLVTAVGFLPLPVIAWWMLKKEQTEWSWQQLKTRLRFKPMTKMHWIYVVIGLMITAIPYIGLLFTVRWVYEYFGSLPLWYMDPEIVITGMYSMILYRFLVVLVNVIGEEVLWRGVMLPRQELQHGKRTWLIHGVQWLFYHSWKPWEWLMLLPTCLYDPWMSQKTQSMTPVLISHFLFNGLGIIGVTIAVFS